MEYLICGVYLCFGICQIYKSILNIKLGLGIYKAYKNNRYHMQVKCTKLLTLSQKIIQILLPVVGFLSHFLITFFIGNNKRYGIVLSASFSLFLKSYVWFLIFSISLQIIYFIADIMISIFYYLLNNNKLKPSASRLCILPIYAFFRWVDSFNFPLASLYGNVMICWSVFMLYQWCLLQ